MSEAPKQLGRPVSRHATSSAYLQRAAIVALVSFVFFLGTLIVFYVKQQIAYFLLSTGFLVVYVFTLVGWLMQKRNIVTVHENGIAYRSFSATWEEIRSVSAGKAGLHIEKDKRDKVLIPASVNAFAQLVSSVRQGVEDRP